MIEHPKKLWKFQPEKRPTLAQCSIFDHSSPGDVGSFLTELAKDRTLGWWSPMTIYHLSRDGSTTTQLLHCEHSLFFNWNHQKTSVFFWCHFISGSSNSLLPATAATGWRRSEVPLTLKSFQRDTCRMMRIPRLWTRRGIAVASLWHHCAHAGIASEDRNKGSWGKYMWYMYVWYIYTIIHVHTYARVQA